MRTLTATSRIRTAAAMTFAVVLGVAGCSAPSARTEATPRQAATTTAIDRAALLRHVSVLAADSMEGRALGTPGGARARRYVEGVFRSIGLASFGGGYEQPFPVPGVESMSAEPARPEPEGVNLLGVIRGSLDPERFLVVSAHYDHLGFREGEIYNGADDNASGTAGLLALAAYFAGHPPRHSIVFAAFDGEEGGLRGARAFVADPPVPLERIAVDVNLDMVSNSDSLLFVAGTHHYPFLTDYVHAVLPTPGVSLRLGHDLPGTGSDDWTDASDHGPFHYAGVPFLYFGVEDHQYYHQPGDAFGTINQDFFVAAIETVRQIVEELDEHLTQVFAQSGR